MIIARSDGAGDPLLSSMFIRDGSIFLVIQSEDGAILFFETASILQCSATVYHVT